MSTDSGAPIAPRPPASTELPQIVTIRMRRIPYQAPKLVHFKSSLSRHKEAIEFIVETDGVTPTRSYGPALFIDDVEVRNSELVDPKTWRFLAFDPEALKPGAPISWGWMKDPKEKRQRTKFTYDVK